MARNTLSWSRCDFCGRRGVVFPCVVRGSARNLCVYCIISLNDIFKISCRKMLPISLAKSRRSGVKGPDERLFKKFKIHE